MFRQSPSRNQRSKGIKVRHVLQICLLLVVCFWLIYQVKRSHDKKKEFDQNDSTNSLNLGGGNELIKFGRKDLDPGIERTIANGEKRHEDVEEDENSGEDEDNKHDEEEHEEDINEEKTNEERGDDNEVDEHDEDKSDMEGGREEEFVDEEKERDETGETVDEEKERDESAETDEDHNTKSEDENAFEDHDHDEEDSTNTNAHEAREENYKADDASSAVTHDPKTGSEEIQSQNLDLANEHRESNLLEVESTPNSTEEGNAGKQVELLDSGHSLPEFQPEANGKVLQNSTADESNNSLGMPNSTLLNVTDNTVNLTTGEVRNVGEDSKSQNIELNLSNSSSSESEKTHPGSILSSSTNSEEKNIGEGSSSISDTSLKTSGNESFNSSEKSGDSTDFSTTGNTEVVDSQESETFDGTTTKDGDSDSSSTENSDEIQHDPIDTSDSSVGLEEKDVRTDLETLPEIQTEGRNDDDAAAE